jgi:DNA-binding MarR family transcriptional regulator
MNDYIEKQDRLLSRHSAEEISELLRGQIAGVLSYTAAVARRMGLGVSELAALEHLQGAGELTPTELGRRLSMASGTVTALVDRLERAGYAERRPNPQDRRSSVVRPTAWGTEEALRHLGPLDAELRRIAGGLSGEERSAVGRYVEEVTAAIARHARGGRE